MGLVAFIFTLGISSVILGGGFYWLKKKISKEELKRKKAELVIGSIGIVAFVTLLVKNWPKEWALLKSFAPGLPDFLLRWDVLTFIGLSTILSAANLEITKSGGGLTLNLIKPEEDKDFKSRTYHVTLFNYAATALKDASSSYITAVSILIPASFIIIQVFKSGPTTIPKEVMALVMPLVFSGVIWFLISLFFGMLALYQTFTHGRHQDLSRSFFTGVFLNLQFISLFIGVLWLAAGLYYVVSPGVSAQ